MDVTTSLVWDNKLWTNLLSKSPLFSNLVKDPSKYFKYFKDSKDASILSRAILVIELLAFLWIFASQKLKNISRTHAAHWWQKLAADFA
jgi:hypothetical protein